MQVQASFNFYDSTADRCVTEDVSITITSPATSYDVYDAIIDYVGEFIVPYESAFRNMILQEVDPLTAEKYVQAWRDDVFLSIDWE